VLSTLNIAGNKLAFNTIDFHKLDLKKDDCLLDAGCGVGRHSLLAYRDYPVRVVGIDLSFDDVFVAQQRAQGFESHVPPATLHFSQSNACQLPFADATFDKVICSEVLEHVPDYHMFIAELVRVLKPGGKLALSVPKYFPEKVCWLLSRQYPELAGHVRIFTVNELVRATEAFDLVLQNSHSAHALHTPYWWLRSLFFNRGENFLPVKQYQSFIDWQLFKAPMWLDYVEKLFNPLLGKSNVFYFKSPE
jgi:2-polyprenyl-3-methyl-5-hydroxy-6-metoxy-1,4-benzoquinol methylase